MSTEKSAETRLVVLKAKVLCDERPELTDEIVKDFADDIVAAARASMKDPWFLMENRKGNHDLDDPFGAVYAFTHCQRWPTLIMKIHRFVGVIMAALVTGQSEESVLARKAESMAASSKT